MVVARRAGAVTAIDARALGHAATLLGAGRLRKEDPVDPAVGITLAHKIGARVGRGEPLATLHYNDRRRFEGARPLVERAFAIGASGPRPRAGGPPVSETMSRVRGAFALRSMLSRAETRRRYERAGAPARRSCCCTRSRSTGATGRTVAALAPATG